MATNKEHRSESCVPSPAVKLKDETVSIKVEPHLESETARGSLGGCDFCNQSASPSAKIVVCASCTDCPKFHEGTCWDAFHNSLPELLRRTPHRAAINHCSMHRNRPIEFYCPLCKELACADCVINSHASHFTSVEKITNISPARHDEGTRLRLQIAATAEQFLLESQQLKAEIESLQARRGTVMLKVADAQQMLAEGKELPADPIAFYQQLVSLYRYLWKIAPLLFSAEIASSGIEIAHGGRRIISQSSEKRVALAGPPSHSIHCRLRIGQLANRWIFIGVFSGKFSSIPHPCSNCPTAFGFSCPEISLFGVSPFTTRGGGEKRNCNATTPPWIASFEPNDELTLSLSHDYKLSLYLARTATTYTMNIPLPAAEYFLCVEMNGKGDSVEILLSS